VPFEHRQEHSYNIHYRDKSSGTGGGSSNGTLSLCFLRAPGNLATWLQCDENERGRSAAVRGTGSLELLGGYIYHLVFPLVDADDGHSAEADVCAPRNGLTYTPGSAWDVDRMPWGARDRALVSPWWQWPDEILKA
jgi:hypothetical protein